VNLIYLVIEFKSNIIIEFNYNKELIYLNIISNL
jgi:hypothetical protein